MQIIDSHCHPQFPEYDDDRDFVVAKALMNGVGMICVGTDSASSRSGIALADKYEGIWATLGIHPNEPAKSDVNLEEYERLAVSSSKVVAIGEIGLDYYRITEPRQRSEQRELFAWQMDAARRLGLPVIIHCRDAHEDMAKQLGPECRGVVHSFNGTKEQAAIYIEKGLYIGLNGIITFSPRYGEMVRSIPLDRIVVETDAPYLAPAPYRGQRNEPDYVRIVARLIAEIHGVDYQPFIHDTYINTLNMFNIHI